jgi:hypothetical protein
VTRLSTAAFLVAVVLAWVNGLALRWYAVGFQLLGESPDSGDFRYAAGAALATAALLFVGLLVGRALRSPWWLLVLTSVAVGTQVALGGTALAEAGQRGVDASAVVERTFLGGAGAALVAPGSWPLVVFLVVALVLRGRSARRRPAPPAR